MTNQPFDNRLASSLLLRGLILMRLRDPSTEDTSMFLRFFETVLRIGVIRCFAVLVLMCAAGTARAQWLTQSFNLKPGWNAIFTHVDASYQSLDSLIPDGAGAIAEIWLWRPTLSTAQFVNSPPTDATSDGRWTVWTSSRDDTDTLTALVGNGAYLVNNRSTNDYLWSVTGKVVAPAYTWTTTGLNLFGFPTPALGAPKFDTFLNPAPGLDLAKSLLNGAHVFRYVGGVLGASNPSEVVSVTAPSVPVTRGQAYWVRGNTNYYNYYYGPVEVSLMNGAGLQFRETLGVSSLRLKNLTSTSQIVAFQLLDSEKAPTGQPMVIGTPQLLVRGALKPDSMAYDYSVLTNQQFTLAPAGQAGSQLEVVLGLNRSLMNASPGSIYAGILRVTDAAGLEQVDVPVSAVTPDLSGLWVGEARIDQVGQYLKYYPKVDTSLPNQSDLINAAVAQANRPANNVEIPGSEFVARESGTGRTYSGLASSLDGKTLIAATSGGQLFVSIDYGATWAARATGRAWSDVACSADGTVMAAAVFGGAIYVSSDSGNNWSASSSGSSSWSALAISADGKKLAAVVSNGSLFTSPDRGTTWVSQSGAGIRNWSGVTMSADGSYLSAAVNPGQIYTSADGGVTWTPRAFSANWSSLAASKDGTSLIAAASGGMLYLSSDAGGKWTPSAATNAWVSVASSTDGRRLAGVVANGSVYTSDDAGLTWRARDQSRNWDDVACSADATRVVAVVNGGAIYTLSRTFASYTVDANTGLVMDQSGLYISSGVNTNLARVGNVFPMRLILHNQSTSNQISLLQQVFVGPGRNATNMVVATGESLLDPSQLAAARRITAVHLPFTRQNKPWTTVGSFSPGNVLIFTVPLSYKDHASNPFLHTFHPDHDNLDAGFQAVLGRGVESYDVTRTMKLTFSPRSADFASLTAAAQNLAGTYEETMTIGGARGSGRDFRFAGGFSLRLINPAPVLTTP